MYKGRKTILVDGTIKVDLMKYDEVIQTYTLEDDDIANAYIIPWVAQKGYTDTSITSETYEIDWDNFSEVYLYKN